MKSSVLKFTFLVSFLIQGCATTTIVSDYKYDTFVNNPNYQKTTWSYFWGLKQPKDVNPKCESGKMNKVVVKTTPGTIILSAITLGIVIPQKTEWCCSPIKRDPGTIGGDQK
ncbi:Bor/Iss family lipoprotein [Solitalea canadensis]|uniref:Lipoprotein n=1 Tax=Solitalea canadensis (strain ATCC 29591 / DSM 3403 / JCM 21819 / LMG 8368 / NBRC 15130 / NCIMB 12057 / USAM 9D) TaxID=929556 RepID=H8KLJ4_SOLCM|nr:hypothetical protein [Solitalea canadensis]AFD08881.1 hypothetical protein Solca_3884 [Solitalea canadensis DSM 3403]